jgi:hypothetical protein
VVCYLPVFANDLLLLCVCFLDSYPQGHAYRIWSVAQATIGLASVTSLWRREDDNIAFFGWLLDRYRLESPSWNNTIVGY